jgi:hypothetical protein
VTEPVTVAGDLRVGDTLERRLAPFTVARREPFTGGWNGRIPLVRLHSTAGETLTLAQDDRLTVRVTRHPDHA